MSIHYLLNNNQESADMIYEIEMYTVLICLLVYKHITRHINSLLGCD